MRFNKPVNVEKNENGTVSMRVGNVDLCFGEDTEFEPGTEPANLVTIPEMFYAIKTALDTGLITRKDLEQFYGAFANCADNGAEAAYRMEQVVTVFNAEPHSLDIELLVYPEYPQEDTVPATARIDKSECGNYVGIMRRVFLYPHQYAVVDGVLTISIQVSDNNVNKAEQFAKALVGDLYDFHRTFTFSVVNEDGEAVPYLSLAGTDAEKQRSFSLPVWHTTPERLLDLVIDWFTKDADGNLLENPPCITRLEANEANKSWTILYDTVEQLEDDLGSRPLTNLLYKVLAAE